MTKIHDSDGSFGSSRAPCRSDFFCINEHKEKLTKIYCLKDKDQKEKKVEKVRSR